MGKSKRQKSRKMKAAVDRHMSESTSIANESEGAASGCSTNIADTYEHENKNNLKNELASDELCDAGFARIACNGSNSDCDVAKSKSSLAAETEGKVPGCIEEERKKLPEKLRKIFVKYNISDAAINDLLVILRRRFPELPRDARTILNPPQ